MKQRTVNEFLRDLRKLARKNGVVVRVDYSIGKGSHGRVYYGDHFTAIKGRGKTIRTGLQRKMLKDLGIDPNDF